jgi:putative two-component system response regulator
MSEPENKKVVLVIDDTSENLVLISEVLRGQFKVKVAPSGARGLELAQSRTPPDLILLDIMMPEMDGYEVLRQLQADSRTQGIPVVFLTAMSTVEDERRGLELGAVDYITKPISPPILQARVRIHVQLKAARDSLEHKSEFLELEVQRRTREVSLIQEVTILALASLAGTRGNDSGNHVLRVQQYVKLLADKLAHHPRFAAFLNPATIELLYKSAPLHDIGKVGVPDRILLKPSELTPEEYEIMKTHTTLGGDAIASAELAVGEDVGFLRLAKEIAYNHQERWDGSGYPRGLKGEEIPISARLMALADVYDALISKRVYKAAMTHQEAVQVIRDGRATKFDPDMVDVFLESENDIGEIANRHKDSAHTLVRQAERMIRDLGGEQIEM